jgi:hypothetical protein
MSTKDIAISVLAVSLVVTGVFLFKKPILVEVNVPPNDNLGVTIGTEQYNQIDFYNTLTAHCPKIHLFGDTTNSSTTYYLMASTTLGDEFFSVLATSTKPTNCP